MRFNTIQFHRELNGYVCIRPAVLRGPEWLSVISNKHFNVV